MLYVGIDVAKDKHDIVIINTNGDVVQKHFVIENNLTGLKKMEEVILSHEPDKRSIEVGIEATGHYGYNLTHFLLKNGFTLYIANPLLTNKFHKAASLRLTKTDSVDAKSIADFIMQRNHTMTPYTLTEYHNTELKSLTRYRADLVAARTKDKTAICRLINVLFPEAERVLHRINSTTSYAVFSEFPSAEDIANANIIRLTNLIHEASHGQYGREKAEELREAARSSIGSSDNASKLELIQRIEAIRFQTKHIRRLESEILKIYKQTGSKLDTIPGVSSIAAAAFIAEIGDVRKFSSASKLLAFTGFSPSMYQSGKVDNSHAHLEKRGSKYLRHMLYNSTKTVCLFDRNFNRYLNKKRSEGKHYNVAITHAAKKLVRLIYAMVMSGRVYELRES